MRNKIWLICLTLVLLVVGISMLSVEEEPVEGPPFSLLLPIDGGTETIHCHKAENWQYYVFLPSYADLSEASICLHTDDPISIASVTLLEGMKCDAFETNVAYDYVQSDTSNQITFFSSGEIATMHIDTETGDMKHIHAKKGNEETVSFRLYYADGRISFKDTSASIQGRGNYTWSAFEKKPYSLTLSQEASLLDMGAATKWVLLANAADASHIRNKLVYDFAANVGLAFSPESAWVELYLNGEYVGLYLLCERNEIHPQRVSVAPNGSFLVSAELESRLKKQEYPYITTPSGQTMRLHSPAVATQEQIHSYYEVFQSVEAAIFSADGLDPNTGKALDELIDLESWVKKYLMEEVFGNIDACLISQYFYYDSQSQMLYAGPVWDFDISLGNETNWEAKSPYVFLASKLRSSEASSTEWFVHLYENEQFYQKLNEVYTKLFVPAIQQLLGEGLKVYAAKVETACSRDELRWGKSAQAALELRNIQTYLSKRVEFLSEVWSRGVELYFIELQQGLTAYYGVPIGKCAEMLPTPRSADGSLFLGWYYADTDEPFDETQPVTQDITLYPRWEEKTQNKIKAILKLVPAAAMAMVFLVMFVLECKRNRKAPNDRK